MEFLPQAVAEIRAPLPRSIWPQVVADFCLGQILRQAVAEFELCPF